MIGVKRWEPERQGVLQVALHVPHYYLSFWEDAREGSRAGEDSKRG